MSAVLVGSAYGVLELRAQQFDQGVDASLAKLAQLRAAFSQGIPPVTLPAVGGSIPGSPNAPRQLPGSQAQDIQKDEAAMLRYASSLATAQKAQGDLTGATQTYRTVLTQLTPNTIEANRATAQLAATEAQLAKQSQESASFAQEFGQSFVGGLTSIVGPAALATGAFVALSGAVGSFKEAFQFKAQLDQNTASIAVQLKGVRDTGQVFDDAAKFAKTYKLTQEETTDAIRASLPVIRQSNASTQEVLGTLSRLRVLNPEQDFAGAARALAELKAGQVTSIVDRFNIARTAANEMKKEIEGGGDAVQVLSKYLDTAGIGMDALKAGASGASGALRDLSVAGERLKIAQGEFAQGPGLEILRIQTQATTAVTRILSGNLRQTAQEAAEASAAQDAYSAALARGAGIAEANAAANAAAANAVAQNTDRTKDDTVATNENASAHSASADALSQDAQQKLASQIATAQLSAQQQQLAVDSQRAAMGLLGAGDQALILAKKYGIASDQAQFLINQQQQLSNATALADQRKGEQTGTTQTAQEFNKFSDLARAGANAAAAEKKKHDDEAKKDNAALLDSEIGLASAKKNTARELQLLHEKQSQIDRSTVAGAAEYNRVQAQIIGIQTASGKTRVSAAQSTALQLQNVEENSQAQLLKAQREGQERLRDQQQDFDLHRARSQEDEDRKIQGLLARGQVAAARREREDFAIQQRRAQEDFNIQRQRTLRNNQESTGDITGATERRTDQIGERASLRGVRPGAGVGLGAPPTPAIGGAPTSTARGGGAANSTLIIQGVITLDGQKVADGLWPVIEVKVDNELALSLAQIGVPNAGQSAVGGAG